MAQKDEDLRPVAMVIASIVRNAMENFHVQHLSDAQMEELNPIIRNAIYTGLVAFRRGRESNAKKFLAHSVSMIPPYWEQPELLEDYLREPPKARDVKKNKS